MSLTAFDPVKLASELEVFETVLAQFAPVCQSYYDALREAGFTDEQALLLVRDWHQVYWTVTLSVSVQR